MYRVSLHPLFVCVEGHRAFPTPFPLTLPSLSELFVKPLSQQFTAPLESWSSRLARAPHLHLAEAPPPSPRLIVRRPLYSRLPSDPAQPIPTCVAPSRRSRVGGSTFPPLQPCELPPLPTQFGAREWRPRGSKSGRVSRLPL